MTQSETHITAVEEDNVQLADAVSQLREELDTQHLDQRQLEQMLEENRLHADNAKLECEQVKQQAVHREEEFAVDVKKISYRLKRAWYLRCMLLFSWSILHITISVNQMQNKNGS